MIIHIYIYCCIVSRKHGEAEAEAERELEK